VPVGHAQVEHDEFRRFCRDDRPGFGQPRRLPHLVAARRERACQPLTQQLIVFDNQEERGAVHRSDLPAPAAASVALSGGRLVTSTGRRMVTVVPAPASEAIVSDPPSCSTVERATNRPRPVPSPCGLVVKNGSPARSRASGDIPAPWSSTVTTTP